MLIRGRQVKASEKAVPACKGFSVWIALLLLCLVAAIVAASLYLYVKQALNAPLQPGADLYTIERGQSLRGFARTLRRDGIIKEIYSLQLYARITGVSGSIKAGQYRFDEGISQLELLEKIVAGDVVRYRIQFIEGWTFRQMREVLYSHPELEHQTLNLTDAEIMARLGYPDQHPEGRFFPDTYDFIVNDTDLDILARAYAAMEQVLDAAWAERDETIPLSTPYEALILASIIEKETGLGEERATISGVFTNRLNMNMRLQTDPTVIYGIGESFDGNIRRRHLREDTPYNTYTRSGLPPTPIAMPGRDSILAAVRPIETPYIYFVSRGDGSHAFSITLDEHNSAVRKYQLSRRSGD
jgi:UPF0755 protein